MSQWYYARNGQQNGPVPLETLRTLVKTGDLNPKDLVWNPDMKDWLPAESVPGIVDAPSSSVADSPNPYAAPSSDWSEPALLQAGEALQEIEPGSDPINPVGCLKRGFDLTLRHFPILLLVGLIYFGITLAAETLLSLMDHALGWGPTRQPQSPPPSDFSEGFRQGFSQQGSVLKFILSQILSTFLGLGLIRIGLNVVSGKPVSVGMLFGGGPYLVRALAGWLIFSIAVLLGLVLLIVPGVYLFLRYGQFTHAIVDRNLGLKDAFAYSASITTRNRLNLFVLTLLFMLTFIAGILALCVGFFFAIPVTGLAWVVAYRWMQYGHRAALDHHGTKVPLLSSL